MLAFIAAPPVWGKDDVYKSGRFHIDMGLEVGAGFVTQKNSNFGLGRIDQRTGENTGDATWSEGYITPSLGLRFDIDSTTTWFAKVTGVLSGTGGDGDAAGFTSSGADFDPDAAYAGFTTRISGGKESGGWDLTVSGGRQQLYLGDGFVFFAGNFNTGNDYTYWLASRKAFDAAGIVKIEMKDTVVTAFAVKSDADTYGTEMIGVDAVYTKDWGGIGLLGAHTMGQNNDPFAPPRDGMNLVSLRTKNLKLPIENLTFSSEFVYQFGEGNGVEYDAYGFYGDLSYTFAKLPWTPTFTYRYSAFSGDSNPFDADGKAYDPLFYGFVSWGNWFQGEIVGEYMWFNTNEALHMAKLSVQPTPTIGAGVMYYHFDLDEKNLYGVPVSDRNFADEVNAYVEWYGIENWYIGGLVGAAFPQTAAKEMFGDETTYLFEIMSIYKY